MQKPVLVMNGVSKYFPGVKALTNVDFQLRTGEIHALMGQNGAGKSTLIKVLTGVYEMDGGTVALNGREVRIRSPKDAQAFGISTVYQEVNLCPNLSVAENLFIGRQPRSFGGAVDWKALNRKAADLLERLSIHLDVTKPLSEYSVAIQQMVAIARAVDISSGVLILDEPTSSLDQQEVKELFRIMRQLKEEGMAIVFVTHFMDQVYEVSDRITVLRNGELVGEYETEELPRIQLISKMIGRDWNEEEQTSKVSRLKKGEDWVTVSRLGRRGSIEPFDLSVRKGEILGLAGLLGSGRTEMAKLIFGIDKADQGVITIDNEKIRAMFPKKAIERGLAFCPEERKVEGIVGELTVRENIILALQAKRGFLNNLSLRKQQEIAAYYMDLLRIKASDMEQRIDQLSGGNQQKAILARWLATNPKLLILDEPTRGIDVGSKAEIRKLILSLAAEGMTILMITSEWEEIVSCCDRIIVLRDRHIIGELTGHEISEQKIMQMIAEGGIQDESIQEHVY
ncbi:sugar ABC transporter ATP-binding protein [Paenibacillus doosanensis]|uniref:Ribose import ATP-binding protein RbsA n=1 Tax=Paenibacillus konkukensis TaxID=2020716 RepID=A0ABY4RKY5_9BACL|nr:MULTISPECIES: sugar ABC transporter ATP-binding protein [Paenibacillus]MCS7460688.1 sugar ABC transporter ATP-binding protein [Paenibacillus doosanensis]UQZ82670.1 Ribose import ATP-binding protein RbsA [Paenibacillus konkukensis]